MVNRSALQELCRRSRWAEFVGSKGRRFREKAGQLSIPTVEEHWKCLSADHARGHGKRWLVYALRLSSGQCIVHVVLKDDLADLWWEVREAVEGGIVIGLLQLCFDAGQCSVGSDRETASSRVEPELMGRHAFEGEETALTTDVERTQAGIVHALEN